MPKRRKTQDDYDNEILAEEDFDPVTESIQKAQQSWEEKKPLIEEALQVKLETLPDFPTHWRLDLPQLLPPTYTIDKTLEEWAHKPSDKEHLQPEKKMAMIHRMSEEVFRTRLYLELNKIVPQSAFYIIPETGGEKYARKKNVAETGRTDEAGDSGMVLYINKRTITDNSSRLGIEDDKGRNVAERLRAVFQDPIDELHMPEVQRLLTKEAREASGLAHGNAKRAKGKKK